MKFDRNPITISWEWIQGVSSGRTAIEPGTLNVLKLLRRPRVKREIKV